jgi:hypothetical protein
MRRSSLLPRIDRAPGPVRFGINADVHTTISVRVRSITGLPHLKSVFPEPAIQG